MIRGARAEVGVSGRCRAILLAIVVCAGAASAACAGPGASDGPAGAGAHAGEEATAFRAPRAEVVLSITGEVARPNAAGDVEADLAALEAVGTVTETVYEPFLDREIEFTGVPVGRVLAAAGVDPDRLLTWTALDDYRIEASGAALIAEEALLATRADGAPIPVEDGGPIRLVFPSGDGPLGRNTNQWIWSVRSIEAR